MTRTEFIIQLLKLAIGLAFGAYFVWWSLEVLDRLTPEEATVVGRVLRTPAHGYEPTREAAMAAFAHVHFLGGSGGGHKTLQV